MPAVEGDASEWHPQVGRLEPRARCRRAVVTARGAHTDRKLEHLIVATASANRRSASRPGARKGRWFSIGWTGPLGETV
jgi:hypothetical protein